MGFIKETYSNGNAGLVVSFAQTETNDSFCATDSVTEAMKHFHLYLNQNNQLKVDSESEQAMNTLEIAPSEAKDFRQKVDTLLVALTDEQALENMVLFPTWAIGVNYKADDRVRYNNKLYRVLQAHTSQSDWAPDVAISLFASLLTDEISGEILEWTQPDSTNAYMIGDQVMFNGKKYESLIDNNVWSPADYPAGWEEIVA